MHSFDALDFQSGRFVIWGKGDLCSDGILGIIQMKRKTIAGIIILVMLVLSVIAGFDIIPF